MKASPKMPRPQLNSDQQDILTQLAHLYTSTFENNKNQSWQLTVLKGGTYLLAINAGLPYVKPATQFTSNKISSIFFGASVYIAIGSVSVWSVRSFINYLDLIKNTTSNNKYSELIITASSLTLGIFSALPGALVTLRYNPLWMLPLSLFFDISTNSASLNQFFRKIYIDQFLYQKNHEAWIARNNLIEHLQYGVNHDLAILHPNNQTIIDELNHAIFISNPKLKIKNSRALFSKQTLSFSKNILSLLIPLPWEITCIYLVYNDTRNILKINAYCAGFIAIIATFPAFFLEYLFAVGTISSGYDLVANKISGVDISNPVFNTYPQTTITLLAFSLCLVSGSFTSRAQIILDLLDQNALRETLLYMVCFGTIIFKMSATIANILEMENDALAYFSSDPVYKRRILFNKYQTILETSHPSTINALLPMLNSLETFDTDIELKDMNTDRLISANANKHWFFNQTKTVTNHQVTYSPLMDPANKSWERDDVACTP